VNTGKKIAIGGSITATTQAVARYMPSTSSPAAHHGSTAEAAPFSNGCAQSMSTAASMPEGTLAPAIVSQKTAVSMPSMSGTPQRRLVTRRSITRSMSKRFAVPGRDTARSAIRAASV
jgi:hypothetical protein